MTLCPRPQRSWAESGWTAMAAVAAGLILSGFAGAADVAVHSSGRYYQDATGKPLFLIGYYAWAPVATGATGGNGGAQYLTMIANQAPYKINYIRVKCNAYNGEGSGSPGDSPFGVVNGKTVLANQVSLPNTVNWDPVFWNGMTDICTAARNNGIIVNICFFDGVSLRSADNAFSPANQDKVYYPAGDYSDAPGAFYRVNDFNNNTGIGYYQRALIDKVVATTAGFDNVMFEIGNELGGSDSDWNTAVITYVRLKTSRPVEQCGGALATNLMGWSTHDWYSIADYRSGLPGLVGHGYPVWGDPDNDGWYNNGRSADRQAAWYSFVGGAAAYGGFTIDYWAWPFDPPPGFNTTLASWYKNLQSFISDSGVRFWQMTPQHNLVSGTSNSCLTNAGAVPSSAVEYVVYVLSDANVTVDLSGLSGSKPYRLYDPQTNAWSDPQLVTGGAAHTFDRPAGSADWVIYIGDGGPAPTCPDSGPSLPITLGSGTTPAVAVDSQGNVHVIYVGGGGVQYKEYNSSLSLLSTETITAPRGAYYPHIMCDTADVPHVVFTEATPDYALYCYYTNRIGGVWKTPIEAIAISDPNSNIWQPRLGLWDGYAYIGCQYAWEEENAEHEMEGHMAGRIDRLTNLSGTPTVDKQRVITATRSAIAVNGLGHVFAVGRNDGAGTWCQEYDSNLNPIGALQKINSGTAGKGGSANGVWADKSNVVHFITWSYHYNGPGLCDGMCGMDYNNTARRNPDGSYPDCIQGLLGGPGGTGPDPTKEISGWWSDDVAPVIVVDASNTAYLAWRAWTSAGEGRITTVSNSGFVETCTYLPDCGVSTCTGTQFASVLPRRLWRSCELAPAAAGGVYVVWDYAGTSYLRPIDVPGKDVSIDLGAPDVANGLTHISTGDGHTSPVTIGGRDCRVNTNPGGGDYYFYFAVSDGWAFQGSRPGVYISFDYYDAGTSTIELNYDAAGNVWKNGGRVTLTDSHTWKSAYFHVTDAYFGNRENYGADFRLGDVGPSFYLDTITVSTDAPVPPVIAEVTPDPQVTYPGLPYTLMPALIEGYPQPTWSLSEGPPGATIENPCGLVSWRPSPGDLGCHAFCIETANPAGWDRKCWTVCVLSRMDFDEDGDVDQEDFGLFQRCLSGTGAGHAPSCGPADLNSDGNVDQQDFELFRACVRGAGSPPGC